MHYEQQANNHNEWNEVEIMSNTANNERGFKTETAERSGEADYSNEVNRIR
jgi:hypothetical protein